MYLRTLEFNNWTAPAGEKTAAFIEIIKHFHLITNWLKNNTVGRAITACKL